MTIPPLTIIDVHEQTQGVTAYQNTALALVNTHVVRLSVMTEPFYWHYHPNSDEVFLVVEGTLCINLEGGTVELAPGQLLAIPAHTKHRTRPLGGRSVNLTFELANIETVECEPC